jgi:hypothetical protein
MPERGIWWIEPCIFAGIGVTQSLRERTESLRQRGPADAEYLLADDPRFHAVLLCDGGATRGPRRSRCIRAHFHHQRSRLRRGGDRPLRAGDATELGRDPRLAVVFPLLMLALSPLIALGLHLSGVPDKGSDEWRAG